MTKKGEGEDEEVTFVRPSLSPHPPPCMARKELGEEEVQPQSSSSPTKQPPKEKKEGEGAIV